MSTFLIPRRGDLHLLPSVSVVFQAELLSANFCHQRHRGDGRGSGAWLCLSEEAGITSEEDGLAVRCFSTEQEQAITSACALVWLHVVDGACLMGVELSKVIDLSITCISNLLNPKFFNQPTSN